jgi:transcriptional regulator of acetoin/glycerol metabolism
MAERTETLELGGERTSTPRGGGGLVALYAPDPSAIPSAVVMPPHGLVLGRDPPPGALSLPFGSISRVHARIAWRSAEIVIDDLDSRNGTFVNGRKTRHAVLDHGDEIRIGEVMFKVMTSGVAELLGGSLYGVPPAPPLGALRGGAVMERVRREILRTANVQLSVLILGETGTGKDIVARALHDASGRSGRFATVNCAAIPAPLLESELFGYKRGAFAGADHDRVGVVKSADGGTLFLDEIGDMSLEAQAKILRMIETRTITPLGAHVAEPVDVRVVCATYRPLTRFVREERFRADLFARISEHQIELPPLRDRKEDLYQLVHLFLERAGGARLAITPAFMIGLLDYDWPFNVRELEAAIKRAVALADTVLDETHLPPATREGPKEEREAHVPSMESSVSRSLAPTEEGLRKLLERHAGNVSAVARELGKDRVQIHRWLRRYGITLDEFRTP